MATEPDIRPAREPADYQACVELQRAVWGLADLEVTSAIQLVATVHAGGLLLVAERAPGRIVGFSYAFASLRGDFPHLHSDMLAVHPAEQGRGLGARLKWAQRAEAQRRGIRVVDWTFDPMQARNAALNLGRLGAVATELLPDFYGVTTSPLHHGLPTDRLLVRWDLDSPRVRGLAGESAPAPPGPVVERERINDVSWTRDRPRSSGSRLDLDSPTLLLEIPAAWDELCRAAPADAALWQRRVARALAAYLAGGYRAVDLLRTVEDGRPRAAYVLERRMT